MRGNDLRKFHRLYEYMYNVMTRLDNDIVEIRNGMAYREPDTLDYVELMIAKEKRTAVNDIFGDLYKLLHEQELQEDRDSEVNGAPQN